MSCYSEEGPTTPITKFGAREGNAAQVFAPRKA